MDHLIDSKYVVYTVVALLPNLLLILWAMARLSREVRMVMAKLSLLEGDVRLIDQGLNNVSEQTRRSLTAVASTIEVNPTAPKTAFGSGG